MQEACYGTDIWTGYLKVVQRQPWHLHALHLKGLQAPTKLKTSAKHGVFQPSQFSKFVNTHVYKLRVSFLAPSLAERNCSSDHTQVEAQRQFLVRRDKVTLHNEE